MDQETDLFAQSIASTGSLFQALANDSSWEGGRILSKQPNFRLVAWKGIEESLAKVFENSEPTGVLRRLRIEHQQSLDDMVRSMVYLELSDKEREHVAHSLFHTTAEESVQQSLFSYAVAAVRAQCFLNLEFSLFGLDAAKQRGIGQLVNGYIDRCREFYQALPILASGNDGIQPSHDQKLALTTAQEMKELWENVFRMGSAS